MINETSKEYERWKSSHSLSYIEEHYGSRFLYINDSNGYKWRIDNIAIKDWGDVQYLSWTEENNNITKLKIFELTPHNNRLIEWVISPAKGNCFFWTNKWTDGGLFIIYNDSMTNYALNAVINKKPKGIKIATTELAEMICIKRDWKIGFKSYTENTVSIFDLKSFSYLDKLSKEEGQKLNFIPTEQGENDEELE